MKQFLDSIRQARVYDLAHSYFAGMPHFPTHPPFVFGLTRKHGDTMLEDGVSSAADSIALGGHVGTHIDALCHFSCGGKLYGGVEAAGIQNDSTGFRKLSVDTIAPIVRRGVLLDIAGQLQVDALPTDFSITPAHLDAALKAAETTVERGDVVLLRTGWARYFDNFAKFVTGSDSNSHARHAATGPGPEIAAARWLS
ncbi:MAG TPA: cyclase family protein [Bryobacteraceae bacterium]|nr:cyclase family protein [Bryobacteraceae bacterium]